MNVLRFLCTMGIALFCAGGFSLHAQNLERWVTGCAGGYFTQAPAGNLHFTVGEVAVGELQNGLALSQGFLPRYSDVISGVDDINNPESAIAVFPNPTGDWVTVTTDLNVPLDMTLLDVTGRPVLTVPSVVTTRDVDLQSLPAGIYLLRISYDGRTLRAFKIQKQ